MKTIIAGSRDLADMDMLEMVLQRVPWEITEVVCGMAPGVDLLGKEWAESKGIPVIPFPADWKNIDVPGAVVKTNKYGKYNAVAGHMRNGQMADYGEACVLLWDGQSRGTKDMATRAILGNLKVLIYNAMTDEFKDDI